MTTLRREIHGVVHAKPDEVFAVLTDLERLPAWNAHIVEVVEAPAAMAVGAEWVVRMQAMGSSWTSRSTAERIDPEARVFTHLTRTEDGNPSFARWTWQVDAEGDGSQITARYELNPKTFWRRVLLARLRHRQLGRELQVSFAAMDQMLADSSQPV